MQKEASWERDESGKQNRWNHPNESTEASKRKMEMSDSRGSEARDGNV